MEQRARFGPAGNPDSFYAAGNKASLDMPEWLASQGLNAYEYQVTHGVNVREATARAIGEKAKEFGISLSMHAPYYISLATEDPAIVVNTQKHFIKSLEVAHWMGADRIPFHIGGIGKQSRPVALELAKRRLADVMEEVERQGLTHVYLAAETHGKGNQLGTVAEIIEVCKISKQLIPTVDFAHMYAVAGGGYDKVADYAAVFDVIGEALGDDVSRNLHIHFSHIEFTKAGEKRHWTFKDPYGPPHEPLIEFIASRGYTPRIICESAGTQAEDAKIMQDFYLELLKK